MKYFISVILLGFLVSAANFKNLITSSLKEKEFTQAFEVAQQHILIKNAYVGLYSDKNVTSLPKNIDELIALGKTHGYLTSNFSKTNIFSNDISMSVSNLIMTLSSKLIKDNAFKDSFIADLKKFDNNITVLVVNDDYTITIPLSTNSASNMRKIYEVDRKLQTGSSLPDLNDATAVSNLRDGDLFYVKDEETNDVKVYTYNQVNNSWDISIIKSDTIVSNVTGTCLSGYVFIPNSEGLEGSRTGWCVAKYELSPYNVSNWSLDMGMIAYKFLDSFETDNTKNVVSKALQYPISDISHNNAVAACANRLVDDNGNKIANATPIKYEVYKELIKNISLTGDNWSSGNVGEGYLFKGNSDNSQDEVHGVTSRPLEASNFDSEGYYKTGNSSDDQRRTFVLSNGQTIWDVSGNMYELIYEGHNDSSVDVSLIEGNGSATQAFSLLNITGSNKNWTYAENKIGATYGEILPSQLVSANPTYSIYVGGAYMFTQSGLFNSFSSKSALDTKSFATGLRCMYPAQEAYNTDNKKRIIKIENTRFYSDFTYGKSCNDYKNSSNSDYRYEGEVGNGVYRIDVDGSGEELPFDVYCDMETDGGGWTLVWSNIKQKLGTLQEGLTWEEATKTRPLFNSPISDNKESFEVYTGLELWNKILQNRVGEFRYEWRKDLGLDKYTQMFKANIEPFVASDNYTLKLNDYYRYETPYPQFNPGIYYSHNNKPFSAVDKDNDIHEHANCARVYSENPFWYTACWNGNISGHGSIVGDLGNGAYWYSSVIMDGNDQGSGSGHGWYFLREKSSNQNIAIKLNGDTRYYSDGTTAKSCYDYKNPSGAYKYQGDIGDGKYTIDPDGAGGISPFDAFCDMTTDGGGWTLVFYSNSESIPRDSIATSDLNRGDDINFSILHSMKPIKRNGVYEFYVYDSSEIKRNVIFTQTNSYDENPLGNSYTKKSGNFYYSSQANGSTWYGLALGSFGNSAHNNNCTLSMSEEGSSWTYCLQDQYSGYKTGPWFYDASNGGYDTGSMQWVKVFQR